MTHYPDPDVKVKNPNSPTVRSLCDRRVSKHNTSTEPTCEICRIELEKIEAARVRRNRIVAEWIAITRDKEKMRLLI